MSKRATFILLAASLFASTARADLHVYWKKQVPFGNDFSGPEDVTIDSDANILVLARFNGCGLSPSGIRLARYDPRGDLLWEKTISGTIEGNTESVDPLGNIFLGGAIRGIVDLGAGPDTVATETSFLAKYDSNGALQWRRLFRGTSFNWIVAIELDASGDLVAVGNMAGTVDLGGGPVTANGTDMFVLKLSPDGAYRWSRTYGDAAAQFAVDLAIGPSSEVNVVAQFSGTVDLGGGPLASAGDFDVLLAQLDRNGNHAWSRRFGNADRGLAEDVDVGPDGTVVMLGTFRGTVNFGGANLVALGYQDVFVAAYDRWGGHRWSLRGEHNVSSAGVALDGAGYSYWLSGRNITRLDPDGGIVSSDLFDTNDFLTFTGMHPIDVNPFGKIAVVAEKLIGEDLDCGERTHVTIHHLGPGEAKLLSVRDVAGDQGKRVTLAFHASGLDGAASSPNIDRYDVYLRDDPLPAGAPPQNGVASPPPGSWLFVTSVPADGRDNYTVDVATRADSTVSHGAHESTFYIRAATMDPATYFDSMPLSGHSLDNIAPAAPTNLAFASPTLTWEGGAEPDFDHFVVYGSATAAFDVRAERVGETPQPTFEFTTLAHAFYHVTTADYAGNESAAVTVTGEDNVPPSAPVHLSYDGTVLSWDEPPQPDVDHYAIYGSMFSSFGQTQSTLGQTAGTTFDVSAQQFPYYYVTALDGSLNEGAAARAVDLIVPSAPSNVQVSGNTITWDASTDAGFDHYVVYGSISGDFQLPKTKLGQPTAPSFDVTAFVYRYFFVAVVDWTDNQSLAVLVTDNAAPSMPVNLLYRSGVLTWDAPAQADASSYAIYGSQYDSFDQPKTLIKNTTATSYHVSKDGFAYHYVSTIDRWGNEGPPARAKTPAYVPTFAVSAFPNPFNPETTIRYELPNRGAARLGVYDARGALVTMLVDETHDAGVYELRWSGTDHAGEAVGSGIYFARLEFGGHTKTRKLVLVK